MIRRRSFFVFMTGSLQVTARAQEPRRIPRVGILLLPPEVRGHMVVEYEPPNPRAEPDEVAADSEGNGWVSQRVGGRLGRLDRKTLGYVEYELPAAKSPLVRLNGIRRGNDGELSQPALSELRPEDRALCCL